ncbi:Rrf2 family protein [Rhizobium sp. SG_E_25_P2]|uniref:Rrf2 family transcriptional regulator n=1 Tax=Rhizobium sp. SG_E_25_P2 TaxID=2879942 RepID=UPI002476FCB6|nr:Rrf2 family transcriptional regulator [Rhizobium sp. SG_E_25_P2]MDH6266984.1 Rrf2 family protein [Rhizobium sp. SG_E_25_P2]
MNTRFAVATHILVVLHGQDGKPVSSDVIAQSVNTHPALIRRILTQLARAGLTESQLGAGGGALLARPSPSITLRDVYDAVDEDGDLLGIHPGPNPNCPVGRNIQQTLRVEISAAVNALRTQLSQKTIAALAGEILAIS